VRVLIVEDEPAAVRQLSRCLGDDDKAIEIVQDLDSIAATVKWLKKNALPDLIFMDIQLADGLSFEIFEQIQIDTPVIFCTAYDEYAIQAFKVNSIDYLLKPLDADALHKSLEKFKKWQAPVAQDIDFSALLQQLSAPKNPVKKRFLVQRGKKFVSVPVENVAYFFIAHKIVSLVTLEGQHYTVEQPLDELEKTLDSRTFFRVNRQSLVSIHGIQNVQNDYGRLNVNLKGGEKKYVVVSRDKTTDFRQWLDQ